MYRRIPAGVRRAGARDEGRRRPRCARTPRRDRRPSAGATSSADDEFLFIADDPFPQVRRLQRRFLGAEHDGRSRRRRALPDACAKSLTCRGSMSAVRADALRCVPRLSIIGLVERERKQRAGPSIPVVAEARADRIAYPTARPSLRFRNQRRTGDYQVEGVSRTSRPILGIL